MITKDCIGCMSYDADNNDCAFAEINEPCPCANCLIKGICIISCMEFGRYGEDED